MQDLFYSKRYSQTDLFRQIPNVVLAEVLGCVGLRATGLSRHTLYTHRSEG
jgi:hypothetical protein